MLSIFDFTSYRRYLEAWLDSLGPKSYGQKGRIARALGVSSSLVSQVLKEEKSFTPDQASDLVDHLGLNEIESEYFHLLVDLDRAVSPRYRKKLQNKIIDRQKQAEKIGKRVRRDRELSDTQKATYYSSWLYTAARNLSAVPGFDDAEALAEHFNVDIKIISGVLRFLLDNGLCVLSEGKVTYGPKGIHVDRQSPFVNKHHQNWRIQALNAMDNNYERDLFFTGPMSLSVETAAEIRRQIPTLIQNIMKPTADSPSEITTCLNIDWFHY